MSNLRTIIGPTVLTKDVTLQNAPTATDNSNKVATTAFVKNAINDLIGGASTAYDTLKEIILIELAKNRKSM